jgi:hypothetical protein
MKAVTTPAPLLVLNVADTFPYHIYVELASSVPTEPSGIVNSTLPSNGTACPSITQSVLEESPRYSVFEVIRSMLVNSVIVSLQTGSGAHESRENDIRGSHPPKQYAPVPHCPYSVPRQYNRDGEESDNIREQHGVSSGQGLPREQAVSAKAVDAAASAARSIDVLTIMYVIAVEKGPKRN